MKNWVREINNFTFSCQASLEILDLFFESIYERIALAYTNKHKTFHYDRSKGETA